MLVPSGTIQDSVWGQALEAIKTPSLLGVFSTPPYLHDGSAATIEAVFNTVGGKVFSLDNPATSWSWNGEAISQSGYSYMRGAAGMRLNGNSANAGAWDFYTDGVPGNGKIRVRYGSALDGGFLDILVDGVKQGEITLDRLPQIDGQDALFTESPSVDVSFPAGGFNISFVYRGSSSVIVDQFTVSTEDDIARAQSHLVARLLPAAAMQELVTYVESLDRQDAPDDAEK